MDKTLAQQNQDFVFRLGGLASSRNSHLHAFYKEPLCFKI